MQLPITAAMVLLIEARERHRRLALAALGRQDSEAFQQAARYVLRDTAAVPCGHASPSMHVLMGGLAFRLMGDDAWARWEAEVLGPIRSYQRENGTFDILVTGATSGISVGLTDVATLLEATLPRDYELRD